MDQLRTESDLLLWLRSDKDPQTNLKKEPIALRSVRIFLKKFGIFSKIFNKSNEWILIIEPVL